jgi:hypothetical protein
MASPMGLVTLMIGGDRLEVRIILLIMLLASWISSWWHWLTSNEIEKAVGLELVLNLIERSEDVFVISRRRSQDDEVTNKLAQEWQEGI